MWDPTAGRPDGAGRRLRAWRTSRRLSDRLETRVKVDLGRRKGRITVEFASLPDLERIIGVIDPGYTSRTPPRVD
jgi:ParB family chromosome partitioning protein